MRLPWVLLPPTPIAEKDRIVDVVRRIDRFDFDSGGTSMDEGLALAIAEVERQASAGTLSQVVVLTDGETSGEQDCRALARQAAEKKIHLTMMGVGLDWKASLIKEMAHLSQGKWYYVDVNETEATARTFDREFDSLAATAFLGVEMRLRPLKDVRIKRIRQVVPEIAAVTLEEEADRTVVARLGTLGKDGSSRYVVDLTLPRRPDGKYAVVQLELSYDLGTGQRTSSGPIALEMTYTAAGAGYANAEVMKHVDEIQIKEKTDDLEGALQANDVRTATVLAQEIEKMAQLMGERGRKKTQLAREVLQELKVSGTASRRTQLAMVDAARTAELP